MYFYKNDAVSRIIKSNNPNLRLIQKDSNKKGNKVFYVMTQNELYNTIQSDRRSNKQSNLAYLYLLFIVLFEIYDG